MSIRNQLQSGIYRVINPLVRLLIRAGLTPNMVTTIGLLLNIGVAIIFISGAEEGRRGDLSYVGWAGALILFAGLFDMLDGQVARLGNMSSRFGALYDSVLDRYSELILFLGICYYLVAHHYFLSSLFAFIGLIGSMMVSYTRARAEGLGIECKDGLMQRPERIIIIGVSALACGIASNFIGGDFKVRWPGTSFPVFETISIFTIPLTILAVLANGTAIGRLRDAKKALEARDAAAKNANAANANVANANVANANAANTANVNVPNPDGSRDGAPSQRRSSLQGPSVWLFFFFSATGLPVGSHAGKAAPRPAATYHAYAMAGDPSDSFPVPPVTSKSLFYLQRTPNANTIICELNEVNGMLNKDEPVHVLWIRYTEHNQRQELNFIQRHFAYGIRSRPLGNDKYELRFVSYRKIPMYLMRSPVDNKHHVYANITGKQAILSRIFIKINPGGTFWSPNIEYLELKGTDPNDGRELIQRIKI